MVFARSLRTLPVAMQLRSYLLVALLAAPRFLAAEPPVPAGNLLDAKGPLPALPDPLTTRATPERRDLARLDSGFPENTQAAVDNALRFLAGKQQKDGSFGEHRRIESTALSLLACLGNNVTPLHEKHGETVTDAMLYLVDTSQKGNGKLGTATDGGPDATWPIEHALATQALAESYWICRSLGVSIPGLQDQTRDAAQWIVDNAHRDGGWAPRFAEEPPSAPDLAITIPNLHALWLAHRSGIETRNAAEAVRGALALIAELQQDNGGVLSSKHAPPERVPTTGGAAFAFRLAARADDEVCRKAIAFLAGESYPPFRYRSDSSSSDLLAFHYDALAIHRYDDKHWAAWFQPAIANLLASQNADGSFPPRNDGRLAHPGDDLIRRTALATLILETPWRYALD